LADLRTQTAPVRWAAILAGVFFTPRLQRLPQFLENLYVRVDMLAARIQPSLPVRFPLTRTRPGFDFRNFTQE
jgi:hypothetical protein